MMLKLRPAPDCYYMCYQSTAPVLLLERVISESRIHKKCGYFCKWIKTSQPFLANCPCWPQNRGRLTIWLFWEWILTIKNGKEKY